MTEMISLESIVKTYPGSRVPALKGVSLDVRDGEFFTLLGPSGCGKTTLLRCIAGLENPDAGAIRIGGAAVFDSHRGLNTGPNKRNIGMVFQSYAIWPHMTVFENVAFPLRCRGERDLKAKVMHAMEVVGLEAFADRYSSRLSGGQQQRVALARAIVAQPDVMLLDEPLSNLDAALRGQMRVELRRLQREVGITTVLVTHDQHEALAMSDRIAVMSGGEVLEVNDPRELYERPSTIFSAQFLGNANRLQGTRAEGSHTVSTPIGVLSVDTLPATGDVACFVRPEHIELHLPSTLNGVPNSFSATVTEIRYVGEYCECDVTINGKDGAVTLRARMALSDAFQSGAACIVRLPPESIHCIPITAATL
ncbi:ABC transporter ATP-binding protein [Pollutimonas thiosulfatoxidans]|uniref:ABC transporter domain-containing protein n=1 Tax=Pollutimonas thiosulfatoxidans TaxID=2028345 RepID=A0A410GEK3_9BURK|nr:ABC transporter ATP-binding protein [Pollutimonas thiosulfatoxidans]QAA94736.1 hypothetical protein CKA81_13450 [Pollutimonas thiosulfatoxidans]